MTTSAPLCGRCAAEMVVRPVNHADSEGTPWAVPVALCPNPECLDLMGAKRHGGIPVGGIHEWRG
jgi:hypothetical protein